MNTLLVMTTGQTDVQLVQDGMRRELAKGKSASLHDEIERRAGEWRLVDTPTLKGTSADSLPEGTFDLCTPKLDAVLRYVQEKRITITTALILETRRDAQASPGDPRYAGPILEAGLWEYGVKDVRHVTFLTGNEHLEDTEVPRDAVVRRNIVHAIDEAVRESVQSLHPAHVVVAATGGFPAVASLVEEIVRLHAAKAKVELLEAPEAAKRHAIPRTSVPEPAISYQARRHALDLIEKGNLLAAWGAVQHLHEDEVERGWTKVVEWLAQFAASLPISAECDICVLKDQRMSIRAALRVELALRAGDIPRAVHGTVAFFESALWDHLEPHLTRHPENRRLYKVDPAPDDCLVRKGEGDSEDRKRPFEAIAEDGTRWYKIFDDDVCGIRLAKRYLHNKSLEKLGQAVSNIRALRNDVAHNEPTSDLMAEARATMIKAELWSGNDTFLNQPLVGDVLRDLDKQNPDNLCNHLIAIVRSHLLRTITS